MPSLFVFSVLGALITSDGSFFDLCRRIPFCGIELGVFVLGFLGGVPMGPMATYGLYEEGCISKRQAEYLCTFSTVPSLSFIISYVGGIIGNGREGVALAAIALAAAVATAALFRPFMLKGGDKPVGLAFSDRKSSTKGLSAIIGGCGTGMVVCCACVVFFGSIGAGLPHALRGVLELCSGLELCRSISEAAALTGFSGLSILCQALAVTKGKLNPAPLVAAKLFQGVFMWAAAILLLD